MSQPAHANGRSKTGKRRKFRRIRRALGALLMAGARLLLFCTQTLYRAALALGGDGP